MINQRDKTALPNKNRGVNLTPLMSTLFLQS